MRAPNQRRFQYNTNGTIVNTKKPHKRVKEFKTEVLYKVEKLNNTGKPVFKNGKQVYEEEQEVNNGNLVFEKIPVYEEVKEVNNNGKLVFENGKKVVFENSKQVYTTGKPVFKNGKQVYYTTDKKIMKLVMQPRRLYQLQPGYMNKKENKKRQMSMEDAMKEIEKLYSPRPEDTSKKLNGKIYMRISEGEEQLETLKTLYKNNESVTKEVNRVINELDKINKRSVSEEEKKRRIGLLIGIETQKLKEAKIREQMRKSAVEGAEIVASIPLHVLVAIIEICKGMIHVGAALALTSGGVRISRSKRRLTKKR